MGVQLEEGVRLIVVDNDAETTASVKAFLTERGYQVQTAPNGAVGLELVITFRPEVVVFDFWMPVANGRELVQGIREVSKTRVGLVAMSQTPEVEDWCMRVGVASFVQKPFVPETMIRAVQRSLEEARTPSSSRQRTTSFPPDLSSFPRVRHDYAVLVVGEGEVVRTLRTLLRYGEQPIQVAVVDRVEDALMALGSITVDAVALCETLTKDPRAADLVAATAARGVPILVEPTAHPFFTTNAGVHMATETGPVAMARSLQRLVSRSIRPPSAMT